MERLIRLGVLIALAASAAMMSACRVDVTHRFNVRSNGTVAVTIRTIMDDDAYTYYNSRNGEPFGFAAAEERGWDVSRSTDESENHIVTASKTMTLAELEHGGAVSDRQQTLVPVVIPFLKSTESGLFTDTQSVNFSAPPLMPPEDAGISDYGKSLLAAMFREHLEIKVPGKVTDTNGERTPEGYLRWNLSMQQPTNVRYTVQVINLQRVAIAMGVALGAVAFLGISLIALVRHRHFVPSTQRKHLAHR